jgi:hypothetical protein
LKIIGDYAVAHLFTISLALVAGAVGAEPLQLTNVHATYGVRGPLRPDNKVMAGDAFVLTYDIEGMTVDDQGQVQYSMSTEASDSSGKVIFQHKPHDHQAVIALGGHSMPAFARFNIGQHQAPGDYQVKVTVTDKPSTQTQSITQTVTVLPPDFGIVHVEMSTDEEGKDPTVVFGTGEVLRLHYMIVGFGRNPPDNQPDVAIEVRVLDENGQPVLQKPFSAEINKDIPPDALALPATFALALNRPGKFTVAVKATDKISNKTADLNLPLQVWPWH